MLRAEGLSFRYVARELFSNLSVHIPPGVTWVHGGDGSGKTTLLRVLAGELPAQAGALHINGSSLRDHPEAYRQQVFWTDPRSSAFDQMSALAYFKSLLPRYPQWDERLLGVLIAGLALEPHMEKPLYMLSTGSKRKVWLAAAFASGAAVTLLDEPFAALDKASIVLVTELLEEAADDSRRAWVVADYVAPVTGPLAATIDLGA
jgi:ABC-type multidrug transport system ATPase subunit